MTALDTFLLQKMNHKGSFDYVLIVKKYCFTYIKLKKQEKCFCLKFARRSHDAALSYVPGLNPRQPMLTVLLIIITCIIPQKKRPQS